MKDFPQFNKQQLELLIVALAYTSFHLADADNLAKKIVDVDYAFEHFAFSNQLHKRSLVNEPCEYSSKLFNPLMDALLVHHEALI